MAQDDPDAGGLRLDFTVEQRVEASNNDALTVPDSGQTAAAVTNLSFGLTSETRTQVLRLGLRGDLRFAEGADPDLFGNPSLDAFYGLTGANGSLTLEASAQRSLLATALPTLENPDPRGPGMQTTHRLGAVLEIGTAGPWGATVALADSGTDFTNADPTLLDNRTTSVTATGHLRHPTLGDLGLTLGMSLYREDPNLRRETTDLTLGWTQDLTPSLVVDAAVGVQRIDSTLGKVLVDRTEGAVGHVTLTTDLANGTAGITLSHSYDPGAARTTLEAQRSLDLGNQRLTLQGGVTRQDGRAVQGFGNLSWAYEGAPATLTLDLGRSVAAGDLGAEVVTDHLTLGVARDLTPRDRLGLTLTALRVDDSTAAEVRRTDLTATYTRDLGQDWALNLGATVQTRHEAGSPSARSELVFVSVAKSFSLRP